MKQKSAQKKKEITLTPVGAAPQVSDDLVDLVHLHAVELHDGPDTQTWSNYSHCAETTCQEASEVISNDRLV